MVKRKIKGQRCSCRAYLEGMKNTSNGGQNVKKKTNKTKKNNKFLHCPSVSFQKLAKNWYEQILWKGYSYIRIHISVSFMTVTFRCITNVSTMVRLRFIPCNMQLGIQPWPWCRTVTCNHSLNNFPMFTLSLTTYFSFFLHVVGLWCRERSLLLIFDIMC